MPEWAKAFLVFVWTEWADDLWVQVIVAFILAIVAFFLKPVRFAAKWMWRKLIEAWGAQSRIDAALGAVSGAGVFMAPPKPPPDYGLRLRAGIPVLAIANLKGGVGKTTIAANLAAHFCLDAQKRVLLLDLDFQGSLSSLVSGRIRPQGGVLSPAAQILDAAPEPRFLVQAAQSIPGVPKLGLLKSYYDLAMVENRALLRWLLKEDHQDIRYRLAAALSDRVIGENYDLIIIDAPPRLSIALINALCAATHLLVPTKLDKTSGEAVGTFVREVVNLRSADICPELRRIDIVASMTKNNIGQRFEGGADAAQRSLLVSEREGLREVELALERAQKELNVAEPPARMVPLDCSIQHLASIAEATGPFTNVESVRRMFQRLGKELSIVR